MVPYLSPQSWGQGGSTCLTGKELGAEDVASPSGSRCDYMGVYSSELKSEVSAAPT